MLRVQTLVLLLLAALCLGSDCEGGEVLEPTLSTIQAEIFNPSCSFESCHGGANPQSGLDLQSVEASYASLVGVEADEVDGVRVVAGDPDGSILVQSLVGNIVGDCSEQDPCVRWMPPPAPAQNSALPDYMVEGVRQWILDGAENN